MPVFLLILNQNILYPDFFNNHIMKALTLRFCHPVNGRARFIRTNNGHSWKNMEVKSDINNEVKILLTDLTVEIYRLVFEWEYNGNFFSINRDVVIPA